MRGYIGRYAWRISSHWPWLEIRKLPPMERVRWWMPDEFKAKRKR